MAFVLLAVVLWAVALIFTFPALAWGGALPSLKMLSTPTCPACTQMSRILDNLSADYAGKLTTEKVNLHEHPDVAREFKVKYVPHLLFVDGGGKVVAEKIGVVSPEEVLSTFKEAGIDIG